MNSKMRSLTFSRPKWSRSKIFRAAATLVRSWSSSPQGISRQIRREMGQVHRDHIIREQIRLLQQELGEGEDDELLEYRAQIELRDLPEEVAEKLTKEADRLARLPGNSNEAGVIRGYLDTVLTCPLSFSWMSASSERMSFSSSRMRARISSRLSGSLWERMVCLSST